MTKTTKNILLLLSLYIGATFITEVNAGEKILHPMKAVKEFEKMSGIKVRGEINLYFRKDLKHYDRGTGRAIGVCQKDWSGEKLKRKIVLNKKWWNNKNKSNAQRRIMVWHEISHCILFLSHSEGKDILMTKDKSIIEVCPSSIMASKIWSKEEAKKCFVPFKKEYVNRLIKQIDNEIVGLKEVNAIHDEDHEGHNH